MNNLWVFDLDNTLRFCAHDYAKPITISALRIIQAVGNKAPHIFGVIELMQNIDKARVKEIDPETGKPYLYTMRRFPGSQVVTYRTICAKVGQKPDPSVESELYDIGMTAFDESLYRTTGIEPNAKRVLAFLRRREDKIVILTKGDMTVQLRKVRALRDLGILTKKEDFIIVDDKNAQNFKGIRQANPGMYRYLAVGDSYASDIKPAFESGYHGVFIFYEAWEVLGQREKIFAELDRAQCTPLDSLNQIGGRYGELTWTA